MWKRKDLKVQAKAAVKRNYWKSVLVSAIFLSIVGGTAACSGVVSSNATDVPMFSTGMLALILAFAFVCIVIAILGKVILVNPFAVGAYKFYINAIRGNGNVSDLGSGFDESYKRNAKTMFFYDLYLILWSILFIIPGIIKSYEYRMIPYILADNPQISMQEAFKESKEMMKGNKWRSFVLDLSFILWDFLSGITFGIVDVFWVGPYRELTYAALYEALK